MGIGAGTALLGGSLLGGVTSLAGGKKQAGAATQAAQIQANAALASAALQQQRFQAAQQELQPFINYGTGAMSPLQQLTGTAPGTSPLTAPLTQLPGTWSPTMQQLQNMPGYQFQLQQGLQATQANMAASGLGRSGAAAKAAGSWASGLAASNWQNNWAQWLGQQTLNLQGQQQTYNMLTGQLGTGLSAAGALAGVGIQSGAQIGTTLQQAGQAQAAGVTGAANALFGPQGGVTGLGQSLAGGITNAALLASLQGTPSGWGGGPGNWSSG